MTDTSEDNTQPTPEEIQDAQKEGVLDAIKASANTTDIDVLKGEDVEPAPWANISIEANKIDYLLDLSLDALKKLIDPKAKTPLPEEVVAGALALERNGKNRTDFVKLLKDRLSIKDIKTELPQAGGPDYTHDITPISKL